MSSLYVICKVGQSEYAIPADDVYQMEAFTGTTPVPGAANYVKGLAQVRGQIIPIIDLRVRFGLAPLEQTLESRIVVMRLNERLIGVLVDNAREVQTISTDQFKDPPSVVVIQSAGFVKSVAQLKNRIIMLLDSEKVIGEEASHG